MRRQDLIRRFGAALLALAVMAAGAEAAAPTWQPAPCPLPTRWLKTVTPDKVRPEYPRPQMERADWLCLNGVWQFATAPLDAAAPVAQDLPERILVPFPPESALSGIKRAVDPSMRLWYRRTVEVPKGWADRRVLLHFGAADWETVVHVNGQRVGQHRGGYDAFTLDITDALDRRAVAQELLVGVVDPTETGPQPVGRQRLRPEPPLSPLAVSGIWQTVWLEPVPEARIEGLMMTPDLAGKCLRLRVNVSERAAGLEVTAVVCDGKTEISRTVGAAGSQLRLPVPTMKLWSPGSPFLYTLRVWLGNEEKPADAVDSYFGMRQIGVATEGKVRRIFLNGKAVFQAGVLDAGLWPDGLYAAPADEALKYDIETARELGFNMVRLRGKVEADRWYTWADKLGLLVWQDMPGGASLTPEAQRQFETELDAMVAGRRNHPCIVAWVLFDEGEGQFDAERLTARVKGLDPTRLVDSASGWRDEGTGDLIDAHHYPEPQALPPDTRRASAVGAFGRIVRRIAGHVAGPESLLERSEPTPEAWTAQYEKLMRVVRRARDAQGLSAAVYDGLADTEDAYTGIMTYDREVVKGDAARIKTANQGESP